LPFSSSAEAVSVMVFTPASHEIRGSDSVQQQELPSPRLRQHEAEKNVPDVPAVPLLVKLPTEE
jgi:hypothetical protein